MMSRRKFLRCIGNSLSCAGIASSVVGATTLVKHFSKPRRKTPDGKNKYHVKPLIIDRQINGTDYRLLGVSHTLDFFSEHQSVLEDMIRESPFVVQENSPNSSGYFHEFADICRKYSKPVITLDSLSGTAFATDTAIGAGGVVLFSEIRKLPDLSRRDAARIVLGSYMMMSSFVTSIIPKALLPDRYSQAIEPLFIGHTIDQRNVEITQRLFQLKEMIGDDFFQGARPLVNFGKLHIQGIDYYLKNRAFMRMSLWQLSPS